ncbi:MAG: hypothetical protein WCL21_17260 [Mariniphaga sp.]
MSDKMQTQKSSRIAVLFGIFAAIFPLTISFPNGEPYYLVSSPVNVVWCFLVLGIALFLIISSRKTISNKKVMALAILYVLIPLSFLISENEIQFLILKQAPFLSIAMILFGSGLFLSLLKDYRSENQSI